MASPCSMPASQVERFPWLMFLFLAAMLFLPHDLYFSKKGIEAFNLSERELVTRAAEHSLSSRIVFLSLGLFAVAGLLSRRGTRLRIIGPLGWTLLFFASWAVLSLAWAEDADLTLRRLAAFGILCLAAAATARRCSLREIILLTFFCSGLFLFIGVSAEIALGTFRPFTSGYRFAGTLHPNGQGMNCALLLLSGVAAADTGKQRRMLFRACALLGLAFLIFTGSRTAFAAAIVALAVYLGAVCSRPTKIAIACALGVALCVLLLVLGKALVPDLKSAAMLGRDDLAIESFNGRTGIWGDVGPYIHLRPIIGYGYGGFWTPAHISVISEEEGWGVPEGHSAYLECLLNLGLVGLAAYVLALLGGIARSFALHRASQAHTFAFTGAFLTFCLAHGLLESAVLLSMQLSFLAMAVLIELGFRSQELGVRRYPSYVPSRYYGRGLHLQQARDASKCITEPRASGNRW